LIVGAQTDKAAGSQDEAEAEHDQSGLIRLPRAFLKHGIGRQTAKTLGC
jgi:hypothetical protein